MSEIILCAGLNLVWLEMQVKKLLQQMGTAITRLNHDYPPPIPNHDKRHKNVQGSEKPYGVYHFAWWNAVGHDNENGQLSSDTVKGPKG